MSNRYDECDREALRTYGRFDDAQSLFIARELTHIRAQILQVKKATLNAFNVFPVQTDVPEGADTAVQKVYDSVGVAAIISNFADDLPRVDLLAKEEVARVRYVGGAYGYSYKELKNAQMIGVNLNTDKGAAVKRAVDTKLNRIAWNGVDGDPHSGFLSNENINEFVLPADGTESSTKLRDKTEEQILRDLNDFVNSVRVATNYEETVNTLLLPPEVHAFLSTKRLSDTSRTLMEYFRAAHPEITRVMSVGELAGAGDDGKDVMVAGYFDAGYIKFEIPVRFRQLPIQYRNMEFVVNCFATTLGVTINIPFAFVKSEGC